ncbi:MATE family efflux transporter, partial [Erysipelothrix rhusiopathiae]|uniref:MATE family efflux transporter n=1 Tax=Erysipelothrix rhusiopathiae TaxID=1648 RepID=UPI003F6DC8B4
MLSSIAFSIAFYLIIMIFPNSFVNLFTKDQSIMREAASSLRIYMFCSFVLGLQLACQQTFIALGNATTSVFLAVLRKLILLMPLIIIL